MSDKAIALLPENGVRFLFVGAGMFRDEVERIISEAGRSQQVIFAGQVEHKKVPALLDACDILLSPHVPMTDGSEFFGSPTKLFEYMAMGKAIVASRLGQIGEVLTDEETALLVEPGNAQQLADAILRLSASRELRERLGLEVVADADPLLVREPLPHGRAPDLHGPVVEHHRVLGVEVL